MRPRSVVVAAPRRNAVVMLPVSRTFAAPVPVAEASVSVRAVPRAAVPGMMSLLVVHLVLHG